ncbi:unnamed protein product [Cyprideis torosa]|uniref:Uncharacterized protein n=1 Tax=Cyprideis torosa TaxID=163714 RepID=A0A7R8ZPC6_9CRUS|nr:unnamed protein product [Cyprideis torosa]CAG0889558.1 unnamed protein product [Cyprideis torosa]
MWDTRRHWLNELCGIQEDTVRVLAKDRSFSSGSNTATAVVMIRVLDQEDQPPEFVSFPAVTRIAEDTPPETRVMTVSLSFPAVTRIAEDTPPETRVMTVRSIDGDRGINGKIRYRLGESSLRDPYFRVDPDTGEVFTIRPLDREGEGQLSGAQILTIEAYEAESKLSPPPYTSTEVTIIIEDVNDEIPQFRSPKYELVLDENAPLSTPLTFVGTSVPEVFDADNGINGTFRLFLEGDPGNFEVTPSEGIGKARFLIRVVNPNALDYEQVHQFAFRVVAEESAPSKRRSTADVIVALRDVNDNVPEFNQQNYMVSIPEDAPQGYTVAWVQALDLDSGDFGSLGVRYTDLRGAVADELELNSGTGVITVKNENHTFDREVVQDHFLLIEARDNLGQGNRNTVSLQIHVEDANDEPPRFLQDVYEAQVSENSMYLPWLKVEAVDLDAPGTNYSTVSYSIVDGDVIRAFSIDPINGTLSLQRPLDYETTQEIDGARFFNLTIMAQDGGDPPLVDFCTVIIYVLDENDHTPAFSRRYYAVTVPEDIPGGSELLRVSATDLDASPLNSRVAYRIAEGAIDKFTLNPDDGSLYLATGASLDPDITNPPTLHYSLLVEALDGGLGLNQKSAITTVNISVVDINNKPPKLSDPGTVRIPETEGNGYFVTRLEAWDPDSDSAIYFFIKPSDSQAKDEENNAVSRTDFNFTSMFRIDPKSGVIRLTDAIDREQVETIHLAVGVIDRNAPKRSTLQEDSGVLKIVIEDANDNSPVFRERIYRGTIPENSKPGHFILGVQANDADKNRTIKYILEGGADIEHFLYLNPDSGNLLVKEKVDREKIDWLNFTIRARDTDRPPRSTAVPVILQILDENDNAPFFADKVKNVSILEDANVGTFVAQVEARDLDTGPFGRIHYNLEAGSGKLRMTLRTAQPYAETALRRSTAVLNFESKRIIPGPTGAPPAKFRIDPITGAIFVADRLDREETDLYQLIVEAWDNWDNRLHGGQSRSAFKQIRYVGQEREPPIVECFADCRCSSRCPYRIVGVGPSRHMEVRSGEGIESGTANAKGVFATKELLEGTFVCTYSGEIIGQAEARRRFQGRAKNYHNYLIALKCSRGLSSAATVSETAETLVIIDAEFFGNVGRFINHSCDPNLSIIPVWTCFDLPELALFVRRPVSPGVELTFSVRVTDVNDNPPVFTAPIQRSASDCVQISEYHKPEENPVTQVQVLDADDPTTPNARVSFSVADEADEVCFWIDDEQDTPLGTVLVEVKAVDADVGRNGLVRYGFRPDPLNHFRAFQINQQTGEVILVEPLDRERQKYYQLRVEARDSGVPTPLTSDLDLTIYVTNVDDMKPLFPTPTQTLNFTERVEAGSEQRFVQEAIDGDDSDEDPADERNSAAICYFIVEGDPDGFFVLEPVTRLMTTTRELDREATPVFHLRVMATDYCLGIPTSADGSWLDVEHGSTMNLTIWVDDVNDNAPRFMRGMFTGGVSTDADYGLEVLRLQAVDPDDGRNAVLNFYLHPPVVRQTLSEGLNDLPGTPFRVERETGAVILNFEPQPGMKGYFDFEVKVNDTDGYEDKSRVFIYLLREDQRVRFLLRGTPNELRYKIDRFKDDLANVTDAIVNIDELRTHEGRAGRVDRTKTDLYVHMVNDTDNSIMDVNSVLQLIDSNVEKLDQLFKDFNVLDTAPAKPRRDLSETSEQLLIIYLGGASALLSFLLTLSIAICLHQRSKYKRELKAATTLAFGNVEPTVPREL